MNTFTVNTIYVNGEAAYVSLSAEAAHEFSEAQKAKGNTTVFKSYVTNQAFMTANSYYIDNQ
jgi:hypothetical protein